MVSLSNHSGQASAPSFDRLRMTACKKKCIFTIMKAIKNRWVRAIISFFAGGIAHELVFISSGDPNRPRTTGDDIQPLLYDIIIFAVLTWLNSKYGKQNDFKFIKAYWLAFARFALTLAS